MKSRNLPMNDLFCVTLTHLPMTNPTVIICESKPFYNVDHLLILLQLSNKFLLEEYDQEAGYYKWHRKRRQSQHHNKPLLLWRNYLLYSLYRLYQLERKLHNRVYMRKRQRYFSDCLLVSWFFYLVSWNNQTRLWNHENTFIVPRPLSVIKLRLKVEQCLFTLPRDTWFWATNFESHCNSWLTAANVRFFQHSGIAFQC